MDFQVMPIPTWALCYIINGDSTGLTVEEVAMIDKWHTDNNVVTVSPASDEEGNSHPYFSRNPAFGEASEVVDCDVMTI